MKRRKVKEASGALKFLGPKKETSSKLKKTKSQRGKSLCKRWKILYKIQRMSDSTATS